MARLKWNRPNSGQRVDHIGLSAIVAETVNEKHQNARSHHIMSAIKAMRERAAAGDTWAQARLIIAREKGRQATKKRHKTDRAVYGEPNQTKVPKGCIRLQKRDPLTGEINELDLPINHKTFGLVLHKMAAKLPWRHLAPSLSDREAEFLETGSCKIEQEQPKR